MPNFSFRRPNKAVDMTTAATVFADVHGQLDLLVRELAPERKVKGALAHIASESGLSYSKVRRVFYRITDHILAYERDRLRDALDRIAVQQEQMIERRLARIRELRDERQLLEKHLDLTL